MSKEGEPVEYVPKSALRRDEEIAIGRRAEIARRVVSTADLAETAGFTVIPATQIVAPTVGSTL